MRTGIAMTSSTKKELIDLLQQQPDDSSAEEIVRELAFYVTIQRGAADSDAGRVISNDDMSYRIRQWRE
jgi:predicted transcriptional regulator